MAENSEEFLPTRASLIAAIKDAENGVRWQEFFDTYSPLILSLALRSGLTRTEADDVVQETMIGVAKKMPGFDYDPAVGSFKNWLLRLARWRITDQFRKRRTFFNSSPLPAEPATDLTPDSVLIDPAGQKLEQIWDLEWEKICLQRALAKVKRELDPAKFQIYDCYVNKEWPAEKVARAFKVPVDHVYLAKYRITELLRREVERIDEGRL